MEDNLKRTPLYKNHLAANARMVPFAGWEMPVQYKGVIEEHQAVRKNVGLFDVSHMGEIFVSGPDSLEELQNLTSNDVSKLEVGSAQYSLLLNDKGGVVDDIIVYCLTKGSNYLICVNASNADKDFEWIKKHIKKAKVENRSDDFAQIAIQGPKAFELCKRVLGMDPETLKYYSFAEKQFDRQTWYIARTGYTGELGVEVFLPKAQASKLWDDLLEKGQDLGVQPIGLGARDTLRTEMKYSLYGHEITDETPALEAGLGWVVKFSKTQNFVGRQALEAHKAAGLKNTLVGFKMVDKGIPRQGYPLISLENSAVGVVTTGTHSPSLGEPIGIGYLPKELSSVGSEFYVQIRGRNVKAQVVKTPFIEAQAGK